MSKSRRQHVVPFVVYSGDPSSTPLYVPIANPSIAPSEQYVGAIQE